MTTKRLDDLPVTARAWAEGQLSGRQVEAICAHLDGATVEVFAGQEAALVPVLAGLGVDDTARAMAVWKARATANGEAPVIRDGVHTLGLGIRAGLHSGEIELHEDDVSGIAVHIGQRVAAHARPDEVLVSRAVADLLAGSDLVFRDQGEHEFKGVTGKWRLFQVASPSA